MMKNHDGWAELAGGKREAAGWELVFCFFFFFIFLSFRVPSFFEKNFRVSALVCMQLCPAEIEIERSDGRKRPFPTTDMSPKKSQEVRRDCTRQGR